MDIDTAKRRAGPREFGPADDMPREYREAATRMIQFHANSEIMGAYVERPFVRQAPSLDRKLAVSAQVQDEVGHAQLLYRAAENLGVKTREEMLAELAAGEGKFLNCFHYPLDDWYELPMIMFFVDGAAMRRQASLKRTSWEPYAHALDKICFEEGFHIKHGEDILRELATGTRRDRERLQAAFGKWWPRILQFFGPTDDRSTHTDLSMAVGLKTMSNDELRDAFLNAYLPKARKYGLEPPEYPRVEYHEDEDRYEVYEEDLDWDEFFTVARNEFPTGKGQIAKRRRAQEAVEWVREAIEDDAAAPAGAAAAGGD
ncbi:1,2-phenylacetyl-CoA epoxidase subunit A [Halobacteriales archaeon QS_5_70_15]|nr:MAG: 1,2-phenylacetyl-CoA epoxidase subunit A [Halobacteriales archaeon QS_5_70_15]